MAKKTVPMIWQHVRDHVIVQKDPTLPAHVLNQMRENAAIRMVKEISEAFNLFHSHYYLTASLNEQKLSVASVTGYANVTYQVGWDRVDFSIEGAKTGTSPQTRTLSLRYDVDRDELVGARGKPGIDVLTETILGVIA